jgi:hypothetical protein
MAMTGQQTRCNGTSAHSRLRSCLSRVVVLLLVALCLGCVVACDPGDGEGDDATTLRTSDSGSVAGDIEGNVGVPLEVGDATISVRSLQAAFQPAMPTQRLSDETPSAPATGEGFYQAYVRVENTGTLPLRVDAEDFTCAVGTSVVRIELTRSGPAARSLIPGTSLDLVLTFKGSAGFEPILLYTPPWYDGVIRIDPEAVESTTTT